MNDLHHNESSAQMNDLMTLSTGLDWDCFTPSGLDEVRLFRMD